MSVSSASGGASALNGSAWIIVSAARSCSSLSTRSTWASSGLVPCLVVGVLEIGVSVFVERADALDPVGVDGRTPVRLHHDRDGLFGRLTVTESDRAFHCPYRGR